MATNTSTSTSKSRRKPAKPTNPPEILPQQQPQQQISEPQVPQEEPQEDASQAPQNATDAPESDSSMEAEIDEVQSDINSDFDLDAFFGKADAVLDLITQKAKNRSIRREKKEKEDTQRCVWPKAVEKAASAAGIRLPGLYPKRGSKSAKGADNNGWFRELPKTGIAGAPGRGDFARELLWELAGCELYEKGSIPTAQLLAAAAMIKRAYGRDKAQAPDWTLHLVSPGKQGDGTTIGLQTCLMHQITLMAASATILRPDVIIRVGKVKA